MEVEEEFGVEISDAEAEKIQSVTDAINCERQPSVVSPHPSLLCCCVLCAADLAAHPALLNKK